MSTPRAAYTANIPTSRVSLVVVDWACLSLQIALVCASVITQRQVWRAVQSWRAYLEAQRVCTLPHGDSARLRLGFVEPTALPAETGSPAAAQSAWGPQAAGLGGAVRAGSFGQLPEASDNLIERFGQPSEVPGGRLEEDANAVQPFAAPMVAHPPFLDVRPSSATHGSARAFELSDVDGTADSEAYPVPGMVLSPRLMADDDP
jgi:hypothetical protein